MSLLDEKIDREKIIESTIGFVKEKYENECSGHDWYHIERVYKMSLSIAQLENVDIFLVKMGALLHDIDDYKFKTNGQQSGIWLEKVGLPYKTISKITYIIENISYKGVEQDDKLPIEGKIIQDADRLDSIGAIGIARVFAYGGKIGRPIHDPHIPPKIFENAIDYQTYTGTSINHFYEKLLKVENSMNTEYARKLAHKRTLFIKDYLEEFDQEWNYV